MDLFTGESTSGPTEDLFAVEPVERESRMSPVNVSRTAMMAALGETDMSRVDTDPKNYLSSLLETKQAYHDRVEMLGDSELRREKAHNQRLQEVRGLVDFARTAEEDIDRQGAVLAARNAAAQDMEHKAQYSLEQQTVNKLQELALADPYMASIIQDNQENGTVLDLRAEDATKRMMIQQAIEDMGWKDRGVAEKTTEFVNGRILTAWLDGLRATGNVPVDGETSSGLFGTLKNFALPGERQGQEAHALSEMSIPELAKFLPDLVETLERKSSVFGNVNEPIAQELLSELGLDTPSKNAKNIIQLVEVASVVPFAKIASTSKTMLRAGARAQTNEIIASAARMSEEVGLAEAASRHGMADDEVIAGLLPGSLRNEVDDGLVGTSTDAGRAYESGRQTYEEFLNVNGRDRLTSEERATLAADAENRIRKVLGAQRPIKDTRVHWKPSADGSFIPEDRAILGKIKGDGGYATEAGAQRALDTYALQGKTFQDGSGQWFAEASLPVREEGFYTNLNVDIGNLSKNPLSIATQSPVGRYWRAAALVGDEVVQGSLITAGRLNDKTRKVFEEISFRNYGRLSNKERRGLDTIIEMDTDAEAPWMTSTQLRERWRQQTGKDIPPRVQGAYEDTKTIMELEYYIRNQAQHKVKSLQGYEGVELPGTLGKGDGQVRRTLTDIPEQRVFDTTQGRHYTKDRALTSDEWERMKNDGYIMVKMEKAVEMSDGTIVQSFIGKAEDFNVTPLSEIQIPHKTGIHRMYQDKWFSKSASVFRQPDTGTEALKAPRAYRTFPSKKMADEWNETMNRARQAYLDAPGDLSALSRIFDGRGEYPSAQEFVDAIRAKKIDPSQEFETIIDGAQPARYGADFETARFFDEATNNSLESLGSTQGRMYHSERGERLLGFDGKAAPVLSVGETLNRAALSASRVNGYGDTLIESSQRMLTSFQKYFDPARTPPTGSPQSLVKHAVLKDDTPAAIKSQFEAQRAILNRAMNMPTEADNVISDVGRYLEDSLAEMGLGGVKVARWLQEQNPLDAIRGFAFHLKLGLFNVAQFPLQVSSSLAAAIAFPKHFGDAFPAFVSATVMRFAHEYGDNAAKLFDANPGLVKAMGFKHGKEEAQEMLTAFSQSGLLDVDTSHQLANSQTGKIVGKGRAGQVWEKAKQKSGIFFYEPEKINRAVAFTIAWREVRDELGKPISRFDGTAMKKVMDKTETYSFQMNSESAAAYQKGLASIPTQFFAYPIRMFELTFTGKKLTATQKTKLLATQIVLYGSAGNAATHYVSEKVEENSGKVPDKGTLEYVIDRGLIDTGVNMFLGGDTDIAVGDRIGTGAFAQDLISEMINTSPYGETSVVDFLGGVSGQTVNDTVKSLSDVFKYAKAANGDLSDPLVGEGVKRIAQNISTANNLYKGWSALQYQRLYSRKGTLLDSEVTTPEGVALLFGIGTGTMSNTSAMMEYMKDKQQIVEDVGKEIIFFRNEAFLNPDKAHENIQAINTRMNMVEDPITRRKIQQYVTRFGSTKSLEESITRRYEKEIAQKTLIENMKKRQEETK